MFQLSYEKDPASASTESVIPNSTFNEHSTKTGSESSCPDNPHPIPDAQTRQRSTRAREASSPVSPVSPVSSQNGQQIRRPAAATPWFMDIMIFGISMVIALVLLRRFLAWLSLDILK